MTNIVNLSQLNDIILDQEKRSDRNLEHRVAGIGEYFFGHKPSIWIYADGKIQMASGSRSVRSFSQPGYLRTQDMFIAKQMLLNNSKIMVRFLGW